MPGPRRPLSLGAGVLAAVDARLAGTDTALARWYPGDDGRRQPVHTAYVPAGRYVSSLPRQWGDAALAAADAAGGIEAVARLAGIPGDAATLAGLVARKLAAEPVEDLRLDFEDGYGDPGDRAEDADAARAAGQVAEAMRDGAAPPFIGIRFKCLEAPARARGLRTLDLFLTALSATGLPDGLALTLPKVSAVSQVEAMVTVAGELERALGLPDGRLRFEVQVETPQVILDADGTAPVARLIRAGAGRVSSLHYGTYDYSASLGVAAAYQAMDHPAADHAKNVMQLAIAGTGVHMSDGSTNILPLGDPGDRARAWALHARLVRRHLERGIYQGWDMHPHQLVTRYLATYAFYRDGFAAAARRLRDYVGQAGTTILDEPATARALASFLHRGLACGALTAAEVESAAGLTAGAVRDLALPRPGTRPTEENHA